MGPGKRFEAQVRQVARARWNLPIGGGESEYIGLQEVEIVATTEDITHLIMCTISEQLDKVKKDVDKLLLARDHKLKSDYRPVQCWVITQKVPHPDQVRLTRQAGVRVEHFDQFRRVLIDAPDYFARRLDYRFGSARNPFEDNGDRVPLDEYVEPTFREAGQRATYTLERIGRQVEDGRVVVLLADFGFGKSLSMRQLFFWLRDRYLNPDTGGRTPVPLAVNIAEHGRQAGTHTEVLRQHARAVGYPDENHLVRVWNGGHAAVLLDGFDEMPAVQLRDESPKSRADARREATRLIRDFVDSSRSRGGVVLSGRGQYFDSAKEMRQCCGLRDNDLVLEIQPFTDAQLARYLASKKVPWTPPGWFPRNPLLISYLVANDQLNPEAVAEASVIDDPVEGWPFLLEKVCERESSRTQGMFVPDEIQHLLCRLASRSRVRYGTGVLNPHDINETYRDVFDESPVGNEYAVSLLQRLPGLTRAADEADQPADRGGPQPAGESGLRSFADAIMADTLRGLDLLRYAKNLYDPFVPDRATGKGQSFRLATPLSRFGCEVAAVRSVRDGVTTTQLLAAARRATEHHGDPTLAMDLLVCGGTRADAPAFDCGGLTFRKGECDELDWEELALVNVTLRDCVVHALNLPRKAPAGVRLENCCLFVVRGATNAEGVPDWIENPDLNEFDPTGNTSALMQLSASLPVRVGLTVLQKVYKQRGRGRKENAFSRGIDPAAVKHVPAVLRVLQCEGLLTQSGVRAEPVWHAVAEHRPRVEGLLATAGRGEDPLIGLLEAVR